MEEVAIWFKCCISHLFWEKAFLFHPLTYNMYYTLHYIYIMAYGIDVSYNFFHMGFFYRIKCNLLLPYMYVTMVVMNAPYIGKRYLQSDRGSNIRALIKSLFLQMWQQWLPWRALKRHFIVMDAVLSSRVVTCSSV